MLDLAQTGTAGAVVGGGAAATLPGSMLRVPLLAGAAAGPAAGTVGGVMPTARPGAVLYSTPNTVYIRNLSPLVTEQHIRQIFSLCGDILNIAFKAYANNPSQRYCELEFKDSAGVTAASQLNNTPLLNVPMSVSVVEPPGGGTTISSTTLAPQTTAGAPSLATSSSTASTAPGVLPSVGSAAAGGAVLPASAAVTDAAGRPAAATGANAVAVGVPSPVGAVFPGAAQPALAGGVAGAVGGAGVVPGATMLQQLQQEQLKQLQQQLLSGGSAAAASLLAGMPGALAALGGLVGGAAAFGAMPLNSQLSVVEIAMQNHMNNLQAVQAAALQAKILAEKKKTELGLGVSLGPTAPGGQLPAAASLVTGCGYKQTEMQQLAKTLFVEGFPETYEEDEVRLLVKDFGKIADLTIGLHATKKTKYALVEFETAEEAAAVKSMDGKPIGDITLTVKNSQSVVTFRDPDGVLFDVPAPPILAVLKQQQSQEVQQQELRQKLKEADQVKKDLERRILRRSSSSSSASASSSSTSCASSSTVPRSRSRGNHSSGSSSSRRRRSSSSSRSRSRYASKERHSSTRRSSKTRPESRRSRPPHSNSSRRRLSPYSSRRIGSDTLTDTRGRYRRSSSSKSPRVTSSSRSPSRPQHHSEVSSWQRKSLDTSSRRRDDSRGSLNNSSSSDKVSAALSSAAPTVGSKGGGRAAGEPFVPKLAPKYEGSTDRKEKGEGRNSGITAETSSRRLGAVSRSSSPSPRVRRLESNYRRNSIQGGDVDGPPSSKSSSSSYEHSSGRYYKTCSPSRVVARPVNQTKNDAVATAPGGRRRDGSAVSGDTETSRRGADIVSRKGYAAVVDRSKRNRSRSETSSSASRDSLSPVCSAAAGGRGVHSSDGVYARAKAGDKKEREGGHSVGGDSRTVTGAERRHTGRQNDSSRSSGEDGSSSSSDTRLVYYVSYGSNLKNQDEQKSCMRRRSISRSVSPPSCKKAAAPGIAGVQLQQPLQARRLSRTGDSSAARSNERHDEKPLQRLQQESEYISSTSREIGKGVGTDGHRGDTATSAGTTLAARGAPPAAATAPSAAATALYTSAGRGGGSHSACGIDFTTDKIGDDSPPKEDARLSEVTGAASKAQGARGNEIAEADRSVTKLGEFRCASYLQQEQQQQQRLSGAHQQTAGECEEDRRQQEKLKLTQELPAASAEDAGEHYCHTGKVVRSTDASAVSAAAGGCVEAAAAARGGLSEAQHQDKLEGATAAGTAAAVEGRTKEAAEANDLATRGVAATRGNELVADTAEEVPAPAASAETVRADRKSSSVSAERSEASIVVQGGGSSDVSRTGADLSTATKKSARSPLDGSNNSKRPEDLRGTVEEEGLLPLSGGSRTCRYLSPSSSDDLRRRDAISDRDRSSGAQDSTITQEDNEQRRSERRGQSSNNESKRRSRSSSCGKGSCKGEERNNSRMGERQSQADNISSTSENERLSRGNSASDGTDKGSNASQLEQQQQQQLQESRKARLRMLQERMRMRGAAATGAAVTAGEREHDRDTHQRREPKTPSNSRSNSDNCHFVDGGGGDTNTGQNSEHPCLLPQDKGDNTDRGEREETDGNGKAREHQRCAEEQNRGERSPQRIQQRRHQQQQQRYDEERYMQRATYSPYRAGEDGRGGESRATEKAEERRRQCSISHGGDSSSRSHSSRAAKGRNRRKYRRCLDNEGEQRVWVAAGRRDGNGGRQRVNADGAAVRRSSYREAACRSDSSNDGLEGGVRESSRGRRVEERRSRSSSISDSESGSRGPYRHTAWERTRNSPCYRSPPNRDRTNDYPSCVNTAGAQRYNSAAAGPASDRRRDTTATAAAGDSRSAYQRTYRVHDNDERRGSGTTGKGDSSNKVHAHYMQGNSGSFQSHEREGLLHGRHYSDSPSGRGEYLWPQRREANRGRCGAAVGAASKGVQDEEGSYYARERDYEQEEESYSNSRTGMPLRGGAGGRGEKDAPTTVGRGPYDRRDAAGMASRREEGYLAGGRGVYDTRDLSSTHMVNSPGGPSAYIYRESDDYCRGVRDGRFETRNVGAGGRGGMEGGVVAPRARREGDIAASRTHTLTHTQSIWERDPWSFRGSRGAGAPSDACGSRYPSGGGVAAGAAGGTRAWWGAAAEGEGRVAPTAAATNRRSSGLLGGVGGVLPIPGGSRGGLPRLQRGGTAAASAGARGSMLHAAGYGGGGTITAARGGAAATSLRRRMGSCFPDDAESDGCLQVERYKSQSRSQTEGDSDSAREEEEEESPRDRIVWRERKGGGGDTREEAAAAVAAGEHVSKHSSNDGEVGSSFDREGAEAAAAVGSSGARGGHPMFSEPSPSTNFNIGDETEVSSTNSSSSSSQGGVYVGTVNAAEEDSTGNNNAADGAPAVAG